MHERWRQLAYSWWLYFSCLSIPTLPNTLDLFNLSLSTKEVTLAEGHIIELMLLSCLALKFFNLLEIAAVLIKLLFLSAFLTVSFYFLHKEIHLHIQCGLSAGNFYHAVNLTSLNLIKPRSDQRPYYIYLMITAFLSLTTPEEREKKNLITSLGSISTQKNYKKYER